MMMIEYREKHRGTPPSFSKKLNSNVPKINWMTLLLLNLNQQALQLDIFLLKRSSMKTQFREEALTLLKRRIRQMKVASRLWNL